jgi:hypothetical protein
MKGKPEKDVVFEFQKTLNKKKFQTLANLLCQPLQDYCQEIIMTSRGNCDFS